MSLHSQFGHGKDGKVRTFWGWYKFHTLPRKTEGGRTLKMWLSHQALLTTFGGLVRSDFSTSLLAS